MAGPVIRGALLALLSFAVLAGCATGDLRLARALDAGRWDEAASAYEAQLAQNPDRLEARVGLGIVRYKLGSWGEAVAALEPAVARAPNLADARLYLGLAWLQQGELARADEQLTAYRGLVRDVRVAAQTDQALGLLRGEPVNAEARRFVAASLEIEAVLSRDADAARHYAYRGPPYWGPPYWGPPYWGPPYWGSPFRGYGYCWPYRRAARFACW
ncbi:MAG: tetratricopeptide repeat protein [Candidatus Rokuibacteriota bacterium]